MKRVYISALLYVMGMMFSHDACGLTAAYSTYQGHATRSTHEEVWVTIFIHGMLTVAPHMNCKNIYLFMKDDILDTVYAHTVQYMRRDPFFYINDGMGPVGLAKLDIHNLAKGMTANANAYVYNEMSRLVGSAYEHTHFYTYGWSGLFSRRQRYEEAEALLCDMYTLTEKYKRRGITPKIRLIGYSHGGNVSLNIAAIHREKYPTMDISVDELILVGMPVQEETDVLTESPIFKKVYHFYSRLDRIQPLDPFSMHRLFSGQKFKDRHSFKVPSKVTQVQVKCSRMRKSNRQKSPMELGLCAEHHIKKSGQRRGMRDVSPGHIELWFFEWTIGNYRASFPLAPLPVLAFIPYMIAELRKIEKECIHHPEPIIFDMRPEFGISVIKQRGNSDLCTVVPFISETDLRQLHAVARGVQADEYTDKNYQHHLQKVFDHACTDYNARKKSSSRPSKKAHRRKLRRRAHSTFTMI